MSNNGLGPSWFPRRIRDRLTKWASFFFKEAAWAKHDEGYDKGTPSRSLCDLKFLQAMLRDASDTNYAIIVLICTLLAWFFWLCVRLGGWITYRYKWFYQ